MSERINPSANYMLNIYWRFLRSVMYKFAEHLVVQTSDVKAIFQKAQNQKFQLSLILFGYLPLPKAKEKKILAVGRLANQKGFDFCSTLLGDYTRNIPNGK